MSTSVLPIALGSQNPARRRFLVLAVAFLLAITSLAILAEPASAKKANPPGQLVQIQLLAFNDYHGHLEATGNGPADDVVDAGGGEYLSAKLSELREGQVQPDGRRRRPHRRLSRFLRAIP
jgi:5'-nucleotidase